MDSKPEIPQKEPYIVDLAPGKYAWCCCGKSAGQPFCDGSHAGTGMAPQVFELTEPKKVALCGCKHTGGAPFCDGSHGKL